MRHGLSCGNMHEVRKGRRWLSSSWIIFLLRPETRSSCAIDVATRYSQACDMVCHNLSVSEAKGAQRLLLIGAPTPSNSIDRPIKNPEFTWTLVRDHGDSGPAQNALTSMMRRSQPPPSFHRYLGLLHTRGKTGIRNILDISTNLNESANIPQTYYHNKEKEVGRGKESKVQRTTGSNVAQRLLPISQHCQKPNIFFHELIMLELLAGPWAEPSTSASGSPSSSDPPSRPSSCTRMRSLSRSSERSISSRMCATSSSTRRVTRSTPAASASDTRARCFAR